MKLKVGVDKRYTDRLINIDTKSDLDDICDKVDIVFFYPVVYRVDVEKVKGKLYETEWGKKGSQEYAIDLDEGEYDLLFLDFDGDMDFNRLKGKYKKLTQSQALSILKRRC